MSAPKGRSRSRQAEEEDEVVSMVGQRVWFVDQIEPVGTIRGTIPPGGGRVVGFVIEDEKTQVVRRVQRSRVRKYGDRLFLVTAWFAKADQAAKELEQQLTRGFAPDRDLAHWQQFSARVGQDKLKFHLTRIAPPTYAVAGQLAASAEALSQDMARAGATFRRVQRALVANQSVMSPEEYAQFVDETRKWSRTVRLVLMSLEFMGRSLPHAALDVRNPDAPLPASAVYIPFESLLDVHTPSGEGKARETPPPPTIEGAAEAEFAEVFEAEPVAEGEWQEAEDFEAGSAGTFEEFHPIKPLKEYDDAPAPEAAAPAVDTFEAVEEVESFEPVEEPAPAPAPAPAPPARTAKPKAPVSTAAPPPPAKAPIVAQPAQAEALPEEEEEVKFSASRTKSAAPGQWLTPPAPPAPKSSQVRQVERAERAKDKPDLDAIIAASLGKTPKKSPSKGSQGEIAANEEAPKGGGTDALSRELASLLDKSRRKQS